MPGAPGAKSAVFGRRMMVVVAAVVAVVLVVAGGVAAFLTYRAEVWGGKTLPDPTSLIAGASSDSDGDGARQSEKPVVKARDVTEALKGKGLAVRTVTEFSGVDRGGFLGYEGMEPGQRVSDGSTVTVRESAGPGVPKDTVGRKVTDVVKTFNTMGVPIHYKNVVIAPDSKTPEGQVSVTWPTPGTGLADKDKGDGIYIGVTHKGDGIPVDILGQDKDATVNALESQGYDVDLEPHYSSRQYVGKISGSYPAPGSTLSSGAHITLYYGVDKSSNMDLLTKTSGSGGYEMKVTKHNATPMIGMYCRSEVRDTSKDCITLEEAEGPYGDSAGGGFMQIKGREPADSFDTLGLNNYSQDVSGVMVSADGAPGMSASDLPMANHLLLGRTGAFELYAGMGMPNCGDHVMTGAMFEYCRSGSYGRASDPENFPSGKNSGETFNMKDFLVYVPVGADVKALEDSGYFDSKALDTAKKQKAVDTSRPFIIMRDSSLYSETKVSADNVSYYKNPFVPNNDGGENHLVGMQPAPSNDTVYYLVEQNGDLDWDSLPDAKVDGAKDSSDSGSSSKESDKKPAKTAKDMSLPEIRASLEDGDFTPIAGKYCLKDNSLCLTIDKKGKATGSGTQDYPLSPDDAKSTTLGTLPSGDEGWEVPEDVGIELKGPDGDYRCGSERGREACLNGPYSSAEIWRPADMVYIPAGTSSDKLEGLASSSYNDPQVSGQAKPDSSKPFIKLLINQMNVPPTDSNVLYLVE